MRMMNPDKKWNDFLIPQSKYNTAELNVEMIDCKQVKTQFSLVHRHSLIVMILVCFYSRPTTTAVVVISYIIIDTKLRCVIAGQTLHDIIP